MTPARCVAVAVMLVGCTSSSDPVPDEDCEVLVMAPCPECGPGEVTGGVGFSARASYARLDGGETVVLACGRATYLDAAYNLVREQELDVPRYAKLAVDVTTDDLYILEVDSADPDFAHGTAVRGLAADGSTRWRAELPPGEYPGFFAIPSGVAVTDLNSDVVAVFDRDGNVQPVPAVVGVPDRAGGMIGVTTTFEADGPITATLTSVDGSGQVRWTRTWRAPDPGFPGWLEVKPYAVESGDVVVSGGFTGPVFEVGDTTLTGSVESQTAFVARLDPTGATRWAYTLPYQAWNVSAIPDGDRAIAVGGVYNADAYETELRLIAIAPTGIESQQRLGSMPTDQGAGVGGLREHGAGLMTAVVVIYPESDYETEITLGYHRLVSGLSGRTYLVELAR